MRTRGDHTFSRAEIDEALALLGMPGLGHEFCPIEESPVHEFDGGRPRETALTIVADDLREAVAVAMQLAALVGDPEAVADLHTRMSFGLDRIGRQRYQFRGYHLEPAPACASVVAAEPSPGGAVRATPGRPSTPPCAVPLPDQSRPLILTELSRVPDEITVDGQPSAQAGALPPASAQAPTSRSCLPGAARPAV